MFKKISALFMAISLLVAALPVWASTKSYDGVTVSTPDTYGSCSAATDTIAISGLKNGYQLKGQIIVEYVLDNGGRQLVSFIPVDTMADMNITVTYPPASQWPTQSNGTKEIHVDVQLELLQNGFYVYDGSGNQVVFGPSQDWDVFCLGNPDPTPTPTPTAPPGNQGCTPGYWRQDQHFDSWPAPTTPSTAFSSVFGRPVSGTMLDAVTANGGGLNALRRHAAAAFLNASAGLNYSMTPAQVVAAFQAAYDSGNYETTKNTFDQLNNQGCPLN